MKLDQQTSLTRRSILRGTVTIAGAAVVLPAFASLAGCGAMPASLESHMALISAVSDRIIPATDTPGAVAAGVPEYIAAVFDQHFTGAQQSSFVDSLSAFDELMREEGASSFSEATEAQQDDVLRKLAAAGDDAPGKGVWQQIHDMVVFGYYTSETATQELAYEEIPGRQIGCIPFEEIGRAWLDRGV